MLSLAEDLEEASRTTATHRQPLRRTLASCVAVLAASDDCIKVLSLDGDLVFMSEGGQRVMEISDFNDVKGCPWPDFGKGKATVKPERRSKPLAVAAAQDSVLGRTRRREMRDGGMQVSPILDADGELRGSNPVARRYWHRRQNRGLDLAPLLNECWPAISGALRRSIIFLVASSLPFRRRSPPLVSD